MHIFFSKIPSQCCFAKTNRVVETVVDMFSAYAKNEQGLHISAANDDYKMAVDLLRN